MRGLHLGRFCGQHEPVWTFQDGMKEMGACCFSLMSPILILAGILTFIHLQITNPFEDNHKADVALGKNEFEGVIPSQSCMVFQRHKFVCLFHYIPQYPLNVSPTAFLCSHQHLSYRLNGTNSYEQTKTNLIPDDFKADSCEDSHHFLKTNTSVESTRPSDVDILKLGKAADSFLDMGLSPDQTVDLFRLQPEVSSQSRLAVVSELLLLGLSTDSILKVLKKNSELLKMSANHLKNRGDLLRRLGFDEERLNHMASHFPSIFTLPQKRIEATECLLREKCLFTVHQASKILQMSPNILLEDLNDLEYKFQFVYFRMGVKHKDIMKSGFFQASLAEVKNRFIFLERLGLYQTPDKKGQTQVVNAKLKAIIRASESDFVTKIACSSIEEYRIFKKLLAREKEENWKDDVMKSELSDLESDEEGSDVD